MPSGRPASDRRADRALAEGQAVAEAQADGAGLSISAVERDTGLSKDLLRVWERRYGFPTPQRDRHGERSYAPAQVETLRVLKRLLDTGMRPGKIVGLPLDALRALAGSFQVEGGDRPPATAGAQGDAALDIYLAALREHRTEDLRQLLATALARLGLTRFVLELAAPLTYAVGASWAVGQLEVHDEHVYTEQLLQLLRQAVAALAGTGAAPRVLMTTVPQEPHGLGLAMAEAIFAIHGCHCVSLGVQTPLPDIVKAAVAYRIDVVALSFSAASRPRELQAALADLRRLLPAKVELWVGGGARALQTPIDGIVAITRLDAIGEAVDQWRQRQAATV